MGVKAYARRVDSPPQAAPPTPLTSLLDEISWEGNAKKYRGGGRGTENALTAEVFDALALLPRSAFLGEVLRAAEGADLAREALIASMEQADVHVLPGDIQPRTKAGDEPSWSVQPDAIIDSAAAYCLVEAKRISGGSFQPMQLARTAIAARDLAGTRPPLVLLVLGSPPPVLVKGRGRHAVDVAATLDEVAGHVMPDPAATLAWVTWHQIAKVATAGVGQLPDMDPSVAASIERLARRVADVVNWHAG